MKQFLKRFVIGCLALCCLTPVLQAQAPADYRKKSKYKDWVNLAPKLEDDFFTTAEAARIGDNLLLYQQVTGGWPKNIYMPAELTKKERDKVIAAKNDVNESTIDNKATTTEIRYLSRLYLATGKEKYRDAAIEGIRYLLKAQYPNGGWPQFWPRSKGYYTHITYNDNAMINVMKLLRDAATGCPPVLAGGAISRSRGQVHQKAELEHLGLKAEAVRTVRPTMKPSKPRRWSV